MDLPSWCSVRLKRKVSKWLSKKWEVYGVCVEALARPSNYHGGMHDLEQGFLKSMQECIE
jgi:hypothetical protein